MEINSRIYILFSLLLLSMYYCGFPSLASAEGKTPGISSSSVSGRTLLISGGGVRRKNQTPYNCTELVLKSNCLQNTKCKWCRSDVVDDMCFSSLESWRLPQQVFFCDQ
ncbi:hypothetical protein MKX01_014336 [Papaver californicum]|nr:hypothetical protein MKX01_014336 [Papaver californicum]